MLRDGAIATTEVDCNLVYAVRMEHKQLRMARYGIATKHACMIELKLETQFLQGDSNEPIIRPPLITEM